MKNLFSQLLKKIRMKNEERYIAEIRRKNNNNNPTIICNNCIGGGIYHNLGLKFLSPTINLSIRGEDFLTFCKDLRYYSTCDLMQVRDESKDYPIGCLVPHDHNHKEIMIFFQHYKSFDEAKKKWDERFKRINWNNIFFIWEFYDTLYDTQCLYDFDNAKLLGPKMLLLHRKFPHVKHGFVLSCYKRDLPIAKAFKYNGISGKRYLDEFDYVNFLNQ